MSRRRATSVKRGSVSRLRALFNNDNGTSSPGFVPVPKSVLKNSSHRTLDTAKQNPPHAPKPPSTLPPSSSPSSSSSSSPSSPSSPSSSTTATTLMSSTVSFKPPLSTAPVSSLFPPVIPHFPNGTIQSDEAKWIQSTAKILGYNRKLTPLLTNSPPSATVHNAVALVITTSSSALVASLTSVLSTSSITWNSVAFGAIGFWSAAIPLSQQRKLRIALCHPSSLTHVTAALSTTVSGVLVLEQSPVQTSTVTTKSTQIHACSSLLPKGVKLTSVPSSIVPSPTTLGSLYTLLMTPFHLPIPPVVVTVRSPSSLMDIITPWLIHDTASIWTPRSFHWKTARKFAVRQTLISAALNVHLDYSPAIATAARSARDVPWITSAISDWMESDHRTLLIATDDLDPRDGIRPLVVQSIRQSLAGAKGMVAVLHEISTDDITSLNTTTFLINTVNRIIAWLDSVGHLFTWRFLETVNSIMNPKAMKHTNPRNIWTRIMPHLPKCLPKGAPRYCIIAITGVHHSILQLNSIGNLIDDAEFTAPFWLRFVVTAPASEAPVRILKSAFRAHVVTAPLSYNPLVAASPPHPPRPPLDLEALPWSPAAAVASILLAAEDPVPLRIFLVACAQMDVVESDVVKALRILNPWLEPWSRARAGDSVHGESLFAWRIEEASEPGWYGRLSDDRLRAAHGALAMACCAYPSSRYALERIAPHAAASNSWTVLDAAVTAFPTLWRVGAEGFDDGDTLGNSWGFTLVHYAGYADAVETLKWIRKHFGVSGFGGSLWAACETGAMAALRWLAGEDGGHKVAKTHIVKPSRWQEPGPTGASIWGFHDALKLMADTWGVDAVLSARDTTGDSALWNAAYHGHITIVKWLLDSGAKINSTNVANETAIWGAAFAGELDMVKMLAEYPGGYECLSMRSIIGQTPLAGACVSGHFEIAEFIVGKIMEVDGLDAVKAAVNQGDDDQQSPLWAAARSGAADICELLIAVGGDVNMVDSEGDPVVVAAGISADIPTLEVVVAAGGDINFSPAEGQNLVCNSALWDHKAMLEYLLVTAKTTVTDEMTAGETAFASAVRAGRVESLQALTRHGWSRGMWIPTDDNETMLWLAARNGHSGVLEWMLDNYDCREWMDVKVDGRTPLQSVCAWGPLQSIVIFAKHTEVTDWYVCSASGDTVLHHLCRGGGWESLLALYQLWSADKRLGRPYPEIARLMSPWVLISMARSEMAIVDLAQELLHEGWIDSVDLVWDAERSKALRTFLSLYNSEQNLPPLVSDLNTASTVFPIHFAASAGSYELVTWMLGEGKSQWKKKKGVPLLTHAINGHRPGSGMLLWLLSSGHIHADELLESNSSVGDAISKGLGVPEIKILAKANHRSATNAVNKCGQHGRLDVLKMLVDECKVSVNEGNPIFAVVNFQSKQKMIDLLTWLFARHDYFGFRSHAQGIVELLLTKFNVSEVLELVLSHPSAKDLDFEAILKNMYHHWYYGWTDVALLQILRSNPTKYVLKLLTWRNPAGENVLCFAGISATMAIPLVKIAPSLLEQGPTDGGNMFHVLAGGLNEDAVEALLEAGVDPRLPNVRGETPLWAACSRGFESESIKMILKAAPDMIDVADLDGRTPMWVAARDGALETIKVLLESGSQAMNIPDHLGETPVMVAAGLGRRATVKWLVAQGADLSHHDALGETALSLAGEDDPQGHGMSQFLRGLGAKY